MFEILSILMFYFLIGKVKNVVQVLQPLIQKRKIYYVKLKSDNLEELLRRIRKDGEPNDEPNEDTIKRLVL